MTGIAYIASAILIFSNALGALISFGPKKTEAQHLMAIRARVGITNIILTAIAIMLLDHLYL